MALGLGAGVCFYLIKIDGQSPSRFINGRVARLEEQFAEITGLPIELSTRSTTPRRFVGGGEGRRSTTGRPPLLITDLYYLDHYGRSAHFPGHAVVLAGYDDEVAYLSDTGFEELQTTRLENLAEARHGTHPIFPLDGHMFTIPAGAELGDPLAAAAGVAIERNARQMIDPPLGEWEGLPALRTFAAEVGGWPGEIEDWSWSARFAYQVIERRGTGGGNFRLMYSRFLAEAGREEAALARPPRRALERARGGAARRERVRRAAARALAAGRRRRPRACSRPRRASGRRCWARRLRPLSASSRRTARSIRSRSGHSCGPVLALI